MTGASYWLRAAVARKGAFGTASSEPWRDGEGDGGREEMGIFGWTLIFLGGGVDENSDFEGGDFQ